MEIDDKVPAMGPVIYFGPADAQGVYLPHIDALVISATVAKYTVEHIFVDSVVSTYHMKLKFPIGDKVIEVIGDQYTMQKCYMGAIKGSNGKMEPTEELLSVQLVRGESGKMTKISSQVSPALAKQLTVFLHQKVDVFAWSASDLVGINPNIAVHGLNLDPTFPWYVDFQDVNKIPQDFYPLPRIDQLVDSTSGHELLSLMDASQGYHQIMLNPDDQMQVSFITSGNRQKDQHLTDLAEMFDNLRKYHMKLNLAKFAFGMRNGRFLGYMVMEKGIEVNLTKFELSKK
ncbi:UNVERIFIED_CONTAM: hypothetical protein Scaly_1789700 [Sesamum calycinum]|uniref:Uncharacterized protein n=1 Tax=Sesamum calycinum TaxID=2727403 RepID=A0AAW2NVZ9_9LAMI